jgi:opacity protein-like surface antigen
MYVRVDGGYTFNDEPDVTKNHGIAFGENQDEGWFAEGGIGCRVTPYFRTEVTVGYRGGIHLDTDFNDLDADFSAVTGMVNAYWDITHFNGITPYVGVGIGASLNTLSDVNLPVGQSGNSKLDFAYALMAGVSYDVSERLTFDVAYRYIDLGNAIAQAADPIKYSNAQFHDIKVGLRYNFE